MALRRFPKPCTDQEGRVHSLTTWLRRGQTLSFESPTEGCEWFSPQSARNYYNVDVLRSTRALFGEGSNAFRADIDMSQTMWLHWQAHFGCSSGTRLACDFRFAQIGKRAALTKKHSCDEGAREA